MRHGNDRNVSIRLDTVDNAEWIPSQDGFAMSFVVKGIEVRRCGCGS
jgi:hypothetical protein